MENWDQPLPKKFAEIDRTSIAYTDSGHGEPIVFVHGIPTSSYLWRNVIRNLEDEFRCVAPDLMGLGDSGAPADGRYHMEAQAEKILHLCDSLGFSRFNLVCHDQGGAAAQWIAARHPGRVRRFILTNCVCYDNWPVPLIRFMMACLRNAPVAEALQRFRMFEIFARSPVGMRLGLYDRKRLSRDALAEHLRFLREGSERFERFRRFTLAGDSRYTLEAARHFGGFDRPTCVIWAGNDRFINVSWGWKLYKEIAGARRFEVIPFAGHFFQEEKPAECAAHIREFIQDH